MDEVMPWVAEQEARELRITDWETMTWVVRYCKATRQFAYAFHTPPESRIGGLSCVLVSVGPDWAEIEFPGGHLKMVPTREVHMLAGHR